MNKDKVKIVFINRETVKLFFINNDIKKIDFIIKRKVIIFFRKSFG